VPACGADLDFMLEVMPLQEVVAKVLAGGGECQKIDWHFLGLSMPGWVLIAAVALGTWGVANWANFRRTRPA
jgi:protein dithiol:quinone oxidoreductase